MKFVSFLLLFVAHGVASAADSRNEETMMHHQMAMQPAASSMKHVGEGVVKRINTTAGKVQIAHQPINELHWPGMTMWFALRDPLPEQIKIGDNVRFELMKQGDEGWVITHIERRE